jgi:hypothetical protein
MFHRLANAPGNLRRGLARLSRIQGPGQVRHETRAGTVTGRAGCFRRSLYGLLKDCDRCSDARCIVQLSHMFIV